MSLFWTAQCRAVQPAVRAHGKHVQLPGFSVAGEGVTSWSRSGGNALTHLDPLR